MNRVFITGGTNGVGRAVAENFARHEFNITVGFSNSEPAADRTLDALDAIYPHGDHNSLHADITDPEHRESIADTLYRMERGKPLAHLVLAASGGLEASKDKETYPHEINVVAQTELPKALARYALIGSDTTVTFLTSHQAFYYGNTLPDQDDVQQPIAPWDTFFPEYGPVAASKHEGMQQLIDMFVGYGGARLLIASTDMIPDTRVIELAAIRNRDRTVETRELAKKRIVRNRQAQLVALGLDPTLFSIKEFADAITEEALDPDWTDYSEVLLPYHHIPSKLA